LTGAGNHSTTLQGLVGLRLPQCVVSIDLVLQPSPPLHVFTQSSLLHVGVLLATTHPDIERSTLLFHSGSSWACILKWLIRYSSI
jgi:hypothetical protein